MQIKTQRQYEINVDGHKLVARSYNADAPGMPIVFLHGVTWSLSTWEHMMPAYVKNERRWYALSLPGHYPATMPADADFTPAMFQRVVGGAIDKLLPDEAFVLVGHSTGGFTSLILQPYLGDRVKAVVSVAGFVQGRWLGRLGFAQDVANWPVLSRPIFKLTWDLQLRFTPDLWRKSMKEAVYDPQTVDDYPHIDSLLAELAADIPQHDYDVMYTYCHHMPHIDTSAIVRDIMCPLYIVVGDKDPVVPPAQGAMTAGLVPHADLKTFEDTGHLPMVERPDAYNDTLTGWLSAHV